MKNFRKRISEYFLHSPDAITMVMLGLLYVVMFALFTSRVPSFLSYRNFSNIFVNTSELGIMAVGVAMVVITGRIDLSISALYCFTGILVGVTVMQGVPLAVAIVLSLICAIVIGVINGIFIGYMDLQPVLVTTATQTLVRGLCYILAGSSISIRSLAPGFRAFGNYRLFDMFPIAFIVMIVLMVALHIILRRTRFGIMLLCIGNNPNTTRLSGYNSKRSICLLYVINSCLTWLAGIFMIARLMGLEATYGNGYDFTVLTIVLMGGIAFGGGKGNSIGLFLSALAMSILQNGMNVMGVSTLYQSAILGFIVLIMIARPDIIGMRSNAAAKRAVKRANEEYLANIKGL